MLVITTSAFAQNNRDAIDAFYIEREGDPLWISGYGLNRDGRELLEFLQGSWANGLNPEKYNVSKISHLLEIDDDEHENRLSDIEVLLTDGYVGYVRDMSGMRINAKANALNPKHWKQRVSAEEALSVLAAHKDDIDDFLETLEPQTGTYQSLKKELVNLAENTDFSRINSEKITLNGVLRPGFGNNSVTKLRQRFQIDAIDEDARYTYDPALVKAVMHFQDEHGLKPDGIIGKQTLRALNQSEQDKINQLIVNMERLRWVPNEKPDRFIVVNIPSYTLWAVDHGEVAFEMPVVVGSKKRKTLSFITQIHGVRFNPTWTVPKTIKKEDILPKLQEDPMYLSDKGMELYDGYGRDSVTLDPSVIDWSQVSIEDLAGFRMVQGTGATNPLGRFRVLMPNQHNIYLHDTNEKHDFVRVDRAKSSGCIRMKDPEKVADFIMNYKSGWNEGKMSKILKSQKTTDVYTDEGMPVYILYYTVWLGDKMQIVYGYDVYDDDRNILQDLQKLDGIPKFNHTDENIISAVD